MKIKRKIISMMMAVALSVTAFLMPTVAQAISIDQQYINNNRSHQSLSPTGIVIHDTCDEGGTAQNNRDYFNRVYVASSAHYFVDWTKVIQTVPNTEVAWHAGSTANHRYLSIEMCNPRSGNQAQFNTVYKNTVELAAQLCKQYGWSANNIVSHSYISSTYKQTDHEDPIAFLRQYGKSWSGLISDIQKAINGQTITAKEEPLQSGYGIVESDVLNVRSGRGTGFSVIGQLHKNTKVKLCYLLNNWYSIDYGTNVGYVNASYIKNKPTATATTLTSGNVTASALNVRSGAGTNYNTIGSYNKGDRVQIARRVGNFYETYFGDHGGWVSCDYIK